MTIVAGTNFQFLRDQLFNGLHDPENDDLFFAMYTTLADIDVRTADLQSALSDELVGSGYTAGGFALTTNVIYTPGGDDRPVMDIDDIFIAGATWGNVNPNEGALGAVIYNTTAGPQASKILWIINFGTPIVVDNGDLTIIFPDPTNPALAMVRSVG
jgi:hypothetical protein